jgi:hypothetical protein
MLRTFLQFSCITTVLISSFFLIRSAVSLTASDIANLAGKSAKWSHNPAMLLNLCKQKVDYLLGGLFLLLNVLLQSINLTWPMRIDDFAVSWNGVWLSAIISLVIGYGANYFSIILVNRIKNSAAKLINENN